MEININKGNGLEYTISNDGDTLNFRTDHDVHERQWDQTQASMVLSEEELNQLIAFLIRVAVTRSLTNKVEDALKAQLTQ